MQVQEIIESIKRLPEEDLKFLLRWLEEFEESLWDREFEEDVKSGRLKELAARAIEDFRAGKCREL